MAYSFIHLVLDDLEQKEIAFGDCQFIVPSQRTAVQLKRILGQRSSKPIFSPSVLTLTEWICQLTSKKTPSSSELLLELYQAYRRCQPKEEKGSFSTFLAWAPGVLSDFDQIDRYCAPTEELFRQLTELERIKRWTPSGETTPLIQQHLDFCALLHPLYQELNAQLEGKGKSYSGALFREASELKWTSSPGSKHYVLFGFNALSTSESKIFQHLLTEYDAKVYWDIDEYFLKEEYHDAGLFIREYLSNWPYYKDKEALGIHQVYQKPKKISIAQLPHPTAQAHHAGEWLKTTAAPSDNSALILADEELLKAVLHCIPESASQLNITMGMPLKRQKLADILEHCWQLELNRKELGWRSSDIEALLSLSFLDGYFERKGITKVVRRRFLQLNKPEYLSAEELSAHLSTLLLPEDLFMSESFEAAKCLERFLSLLEELHELHHNKISAADQQAFILLRSLLGDTQVFLQEYPFLNSPSALYGLYTQSLQSQSLDFIGDPFEGPQLMGILESRNLAFRRIMITSVNEGILPKGEIAQSSIPYELQKHYGLPTTKEKDALFTYHFYRILQWAEEIELCYSAPTDALMGGEPSRLIQQLLADPLPKHVLEHRILGAEVHIQAATPIAIHKTPPLVTRLKEYAQEGFSPSSLSLYLRNPLEFYKQYVLRVQETVKPELGLAPRLLGNVIHKCLQWLYEPVLGRILDAEFYTEAVAAIDSLVRRALLEEVPGQETTKGKYVLIQKVIERYLRNFLEQEREVAAEQELVVLQLEQKYRCTISLGPDYPEVVLKGSIDRMERLNGVLRIADYKTGTVNNADLNFEGIGPELREENQQKILQLLFYALLFFKNTGDLPGEVGLYAIKEKGSGLKSLSTGQRKNKTSVHLSQDDLKQYEVFLKHLISEIVEPSIPIVENLDH